MIRKFLPLLLLITLAVVLGKFGRQWIGIELTPRAIQEWVASLEWMGPLTFTGLVIFRQFLVLPAGLLLSAGGLCFGILFGALLGSIGILLSAVMKFSVTRYLAPESLRRQMTWRLRGIEQRLKSSGPFVVAIATAHPLAPMAWVHWGAGLATIPIATFTAAVALGAAPRALAYSYLGSTFLEDESGPLYFAIAAVVLLTVVPLAHPRVRGLLRSARLPHAVESEGDALVSIVAPLSDTGESPRNS